MTDCAADVGQRIDRLADQLAATGALTKPHWRAALHAVPRHLFVPRVSWANDAVADRAASPQGWLDVVYSDVPLVTQLDDGGADGRSGEGLYTSSCSAPGAVIDTLERLGPDPGDRVLEIGTGTGWTAALLECRVGRGNVTSVEIDPALLAQAAVNLEATGYAPHLVNGDGAAGWPDGAPYDRVHSTCAVARVPFEWVEQCCSGGVLVTPYQPPFSDGHLVRLTVRRDGTAAGHFECGMNYMMMRSQRWPAADSRAWVERGPARDTKSLTTTDPRLIGHAPAGACLAISAYAPGVMRVAGDDAVWLLDAAGPGSSWACASYEPVTGGFEVQQCGPRRLWDENEAAFSGWLALGSPGRDRFGLTVARGGQQLWVDDPGNVLSPPG